MKVRRILITLLLCLLLVLPVGAHRTAIRSKSHRSRLGGLPTVRYDPRLVTMTPSMGKRSGPGPFAAAIIAQGRWDGTGTPDIMTFPRGSMIKGAWFANHDANQGSLVLWLTPEWDGDDGLHHHIFGREQFGISLQKRSDDTVR